MIERGAKMQCLMRKLRESTGEISAILGDRSLSLNTELTSLIESSIFA